MSPSMKHQVVVVTGANSGIGKATAVGLAQAGATVVMACRDLDRSAAALREVRSRSGSDQVHLMRLDLASQESIREFVRAFTGRFDRLDVLVNNAGVASPRRQETEDGLELHFGVHHIGTFLLTTLLLPLLEASAPSRVLVVVGSAQRFGKIAFDDLQSERRYSMIRAGGQSRLANLLFVRALALRARGVTVNGIDPGNTRTGISRDLPAPVRLLAPLVLKSPEKGARTSLYLATSPEVAGVTGRYFKNSHHIKPNPLALDDSLAQRLWNVSAQLTAASAAAE